MSHTKSDSAKESTVTVRVTGILEGNDEMPWLGDYILSVIREAPSAGKCTHAHHHG